MSLRPASRRQTGIPAFARTSRTKPSFTSFSLTLVRIAPFILSGAVKQRSSRCAAALSITSWVSVSLTLMIQPFLSSWRPERSGPLTRTSPGSAKAEGAVGSRAHRASSDNDTNASFRPESQSFLTRARLILKGAGYALMSGIIEKLLLRNLQEVFGEGDPTRRRAAIEELYTEDCTVLLPIGRFVGRAALDQVAGELRASHPRSVHRAPPAVGRPGWRASGMAPAGPACRPGAGAGRRPYLDDGSPTCKRASSQPSDTLWADPQHQAPTQEDDANDGPVSPAR